MHNHKKYKALTSFPERIMIISETAMKRMKQTANHMVGGKAVIKLIYNYEEDLVMKKAAAMLLTAAMVVSLAGCGGDKGNAVAGTTGKSSTTSGNRLRMMGRRFIR